MVEKNIYIYNYIYNISSILLALSIGPLSIWRCLTFGGCLSGATAPSKNPQVWSPDSSEELHQIVRELPDVLGVVEGRRTGGTFMTYLDPPTKHHGTHTK